MVKWFVVRVNVKRSRKDFWLGAHTWTELDRIDFIEVIIVRFSNHDGLNQITFIGLVSSENYDRRPRIITPIA